LAIYHIQAVFSFFTHLVNVLGADDFLVPVCVLLVEKFANRVVRQNTEDSRNSLALPISIIQHYESSLQTRVSDWYMYAAIY
jgi:U3 small nucleolar RNA-associated protein 10